MNFISFLFYWVLIITIIFLFIYVYLLVNKPYICLDHLTTPEKMNELNNYLINEKKIYNRESKGFIARGQKHGRSITLTDSLLKKGTKLCENRKKKGSSNWHIPSSEYYEFDFLINFIKELNIFEDIGNIVIIINDKFEKGVEHKDHGCKDWVSEFIWIRTNNDKLFYIRDKLGYTHTNKCNLMWFDDTMFHNIHPINKDSFSIRVDGKFNPSFRNYMYKNAPFSCESNREALKKNKKKIY